VGLEGILEVQKLERPYTVVKGKKYLLQEKGTSGEPPAYHEVTFWGYAPSAAQIVVGRNGTKVVVDRKDVFLKPDERDGGKHQ
jgi:hypothetical protein